MSNVLTASLITRFNECAAQWIYQAFGAFCLIRAWTQWRTEGFWRLVRRWELAPLPSACQTGKRKGALPRYWGGLGRSPSRQRFWEHLDVNGTHFWIALTSFSTLLAPTVGLQRWGAAANGTGACRLAHIGGVEHVPQNVELYVLFLHKGAKIWKGTKTVGYGYLS